MTGLIILTCRNNLALTKACYATLLKQEPPCRILIVDNASTDGTAKWPVLDWRITLEFKSVAQMWNEALRWAWAKGYTEALVLNNDTELLPETHAILSAWLAKPSSSNTGMVTCVSRRTREDLLPFAEALASEEGFMEITERPNPDFSCFMIRRSTWEAIGGFDENCEVAFCEDNCAHVELHRKGIRAVSISLPFLHHGSATIKSADEAERKRITEAAARNREYFYRKYGKQIGTPEYDELFTEETFGCEALQFNKPTR